MTEATSPAGGTPTDEQLLALMPRQFREDLDTISLVSADFRAVEPNELPGNMDRGAVDYARAVWAAAQAATVNQPIPPADGEVEELATLIDQAATAWHWMPEVPLLGHMTAGQLSRAAALLRQLRPVQPVPVSELPEAVDCDGDRMRWWFRPIAFLEVGLCAYWCLAPMDSEPSYFTHWLPAHALPLPSGEVQA